MSDAAAFELPDAEALAALSDAELSTLREAAMAEANALSGQDTFSELDAEKLTTLADAVDAIDAQLEANASRDAELATKRDELTARLAAKSKKKDDEDKKDKDGKPFAESTDVADAEVVEVVEVVAATKPSLRAIANKAKTVAPVTPAVERPKVIIAAASDVPGLPTGSSVENLDGLVSAVMSRWNAYKGAPQARGSRVRHGLATFQIPFGEGLVASGGDDTEVLKYAANQSRLPGGSLIAAGGWCSPSETMYDVCSAGDATGLYDLPTAGAPRGGIRYTRALDYSTIFEQIQALTLCATEAELEEEPPLEKDCIEVDCPDFTEVRLDACWLCVKTALLQNKAFPEYVREFIRTAVISHQNLMDTRKINAVVTLLGAATVIPATFGTIAQLVAAIDLAAIDFRYRHSMPLTATLEVVLPEWLIGALRDDFVRRQFNLADDLTKAQLNRYFAERNVSVQWIRNWQATGFGQAAEATAYPTTAQFMLYEAGSYVHLREDIIRVDTLSDSALLTTNRQLGLFMEEGWAVAPMCKDGRLYTFSICNSGSTGGPIASPPGVFTCGQA